LKEKKMEIRKEKEKQNKTEMSDHLAN